jgi:uncharacterized membrane protein
MSMTKRAGFVFTIVLGGVLFLFPLVILIALLKRAYQMMMVVAKPIDAFIPMDSVGEIALVNILAAIAILAACFGAGLAARSALGRRIFNTADENMQLFIPGYGLMRQKLTAAVGREDDERSLKPILVQFDDQAQIAFEVERSDDGLVAVFLPGAPDPWSGAAVFVTADRVFPVGVEVKPATKIFKRLGRGSIAALGGVRSQPPSPG